MVVKLPDIEVGIAGAFDAWRVAGTGGNDGTNIEGCKGDLDAASK